jgi:hypothetical protein
MSYIACKFAAGSARIDLCRVGICATCVRNRLFYFNINVVAAVQAIQVEHRREIQLLSQH